MAHYLQGDVPVDQTPSGGRRVARSLITWEKAWKSWSEIPTPDPNIQPSPNRTKSPCLDCQMNQKPTVDWQVLLEINAASEL